MQRDRQNMRSFYAFCSRNITNKIYKSIILFMLGNVHESQFKGEFRSPRCFSTSDAIFLLSCSVYFSRSLLAALTRMHWPKCRLDTGGIYTKLSQMVALLIQFYEHLSPQGTCSFLTRDNMGPRY
jgi:hypothetical protein